MIRNAASFRAKRRLHGLSEVQGTPLAVAVVPAKAQVGLTFKASIRGIPAVRSRRGPRRRRPLSLRADKGYFSAAHLAWLRERGTIPHDARPGVETRVSGPSRPSDLR
ncbi:transposase [Streptomyces canus]|uniref:transposase n=1 Tax=Streptomyces canus TaxID=58343 RepID=UPI00131A3F00